MLTDDIREKFRKIKIFGERNAKSHEEKNLSDLSVIGYMKYLLESHENDFLIQVSVCGTYQTVTRL